MKTTAILALLLAAVACPRTATADMFGSGDNTFEIDFVMIGDPGAAPDTALVGQQVFQRTVLVGVATCIETGVSLVDHRATG